MKKLFAILTLFFCIYCVNAQVNINTSSNDGRLRIGGGLGLGFGNNDYFGLNIYPSIGYLLTDKLEGGISLGYQYAKDNNIKSNLFSGGPYANYYILNNLFARGHFEYLTGNQKLKNYDFENNIDESALWLGGGYRSGGKLSFQTGVMYNVLHDNSSIYKNAIRPFFGVNFGF